MSATVEIKAAAKPRWYQFRYRLSVALVNIARRIYPENPDVTAFHMQLMTDYLIAGGAVVRVNPETMMEPKP